MQDLSFDSSNFDFKFNLVSSPKLQFLSIRCLLPDNDQIFRKSKPPWRKVSFFTTASVMMGI